MVFYQSDKQTQIWENETLRICTEKQQKSREALSLTAQMLEMLDGFKLTTSSLPTWKNKRNPNSKLEVIIIIYMTGSCF